MLCFENELAIKSAHSQDQRPRLGLIGQKGNMEWAGNKSREIKVFPVCCVTQILLMNKEINPAELDFLLRYPVQPGVTSPVDFLSNHSWGGIKVRRESEADVVVASPGCELVGSFSWNRWCWNHGGTAATVVADDKYWVKLVNCFVLLFR